MKKIFSFLFTVSVIFFSLIGIVSLAGFFVGVNFFCDEVVCEEVIEKERVNNLTQVWGLWMNDMRWEQARNVARKHDEMGDWVCVNVRFVKNYEDMVRVCNHEVGHEIFARHCEKDIERCIEVVRLKE